MFILGNGLSDLRRVEGFYLHERLVGRSQVRSIVMADFEVMLLQIFKLLFLSKLIILSLVLGLLFRFEIFFCVLFDVKVLRRQNHLFFLLNWIRTIFLVSFYGVIKIHSTQIGIAL